MQYIGYEPKDTAEKFTLDKFKHNEAHFRFSTGFETYDVF